MTSVGSSGVKNGRRRHAGTVAPPLIDSLHRLVAPIRAEGFTTVWRWLSLLKISSGWRICRNELPSHRDYRFLEAPRQLARWTVQIACGPRSRDSISPPPTACPGLRTGEAQAAAGRSADLRLAESARGVSPLAAHRSVREMRTLASYGSCHLPKGAASHRNPWVHPVSRWLTGLGSARTRATVVETSNFRDARRRRGVRLSRCTECSATIGAPPRWHR